MNAKRFIFAIAIIVIVALAAPACIDVSDLNADLTPVTQTVDAALYEDKVIFRAMTLTVEAGK